MREFRSSLVKNCTRKTEASPTGTRQVSEMNLEVGGAIPVTSQNAPGVRLTNLSDLPRQPIASPLYCNFFFIFIKLLVYLMLGFF